MTRASQIDMMKFGHDGTKNTKSGPDQGESPPGVGIFPMPSVSSWCKQAAHVRKKPAPMMRQCFEGDREKWARGL